MSNTFTALTNSQIRRLDKRQCDALDKAATSDGPVGEMMRDVIRERMNEDAAGAEMDLQRPDRFEMK